MLGETTKSFVMEADENLEFPFISVMFVVFEDSFVTDIACTYYDLSVSKNIKLPFKDLGFAQGPRVIAPNVNLMDEIIIKDGSFFSIVLKNETRINTRGRLNVLATYIPLKILEKEHAIDLKISQ